MRILFICGSLEPGKDGVGDYTRRLAGTLLQMDCQIAILAFSDRFTKVPLEAVQWGEGMKIQTLRLPSNLTTSERNSRAQKFVKLFGPDILSLQFVLYAFHKKGIPFGLEKSLKTIANGIPWHFMFHELWIGMESDATIKDRILGFVQQKIINRLVTVLKPQVVHSHTPLYIHKLGSMGFTANRLPLFSNIAPSSNGQIVRKTESYDFKKKQIDFIVFGYINPGAPIADFAKEMSDFAQAQETKVTLTLIGRNGAQKVPWKNTWTYFGLEFREIGEQPAEAISEYLSNADIGITTTPLLLSEKSGTVAAMRSHALPILCIARPWQVKDYVPSREERIKPYEKGVISNDFLSLLREDVATTNHLAKVAEMFLEDITQADSNG